MAALTTAIGSLPHHNVDSALEFSFKLGLPFLPQIPIRNPREFMISQALDGLPGLRLESGGFVSLDLGKWEAGSAPLKARLDTAFAAPPGDLSAFDSFLPSAESAACWQPFLWELEERGIKRAKVQIAGPLTCQWAMRLSDGKTLDQHPEISNQIFQLLLARSIAMVRRLRSTGISPWIYLDEPGLFGVSKNNPLHQVGLRELQLYVHSLRKENAIVGLHCCSNTDWSTLLTLGIDVLSIDTALSLESLFADQKTVYWFLERGGRLSLGVVPTGLSSEEIRALDTPRLIESFQSIWKRCWKQDPEAERLALENAIWTPSCGLALHTPEDAETILNRLLEFAENYSPQEN